MLEGDRNCRKSPTERLSSFVRNRTMALRECRTRVRRASGHSASREPRSASYSALILAASMTFFHRAVSSLM